MAYGLQTIFEETVSAVTATPSVPLGTRRVEGIKEYIYVYNGGATAALGYGMITSCNSLGTVVVSSVSGDVCAGIVQSNELTQSYYGWLQTKGPVNCESADAVAAGAPVYLQANGSVEQVTTATSLGLGVGVVFGHATTAIASGASGQVWVRGNGM